MDFRVAFRKNVRKKLQEKSTIDAVHYEIKELVDYDLGVHSFMVTIVTDTFIGMSRARRENIVHSYFLEERTNAMITVWTILTVAEYMAENPHWTPSGVVTEEGGQDNGRVSAQEPKKRTRKRKPRKRGPKNTSDPAAVV